MKSKCWPVIATRGRPDWLNRQLDRLEPQLIRGECIIVVVDGDTETIAALEDRRGRRDDGAAPRFREVALEHRGGADHARRIGNALVPADAVIVEIDDHDLAEPTLLEKLREAFAAPGTAGAYCDCWHTDSNETVRRPHDKDPDATMATGGHLGWGMRAYRKWVYDMVGGYPADYFPVNDYALMAMIEQLMGEAAITHIQERLVTVVEDIGGITNLHREEIDEQVVAVANIALAARFKLPFARGKEHMPVSIIGDVEKNQPWQLRSIRCAQTILATPTRNRLDHLKQTLPLALEQECWFVLVVDFGSGDGTVEWLKSLRHPKLVVVECVGAEAEDWCYVRAQNTAIRLACSLGANIIGLFDCDVKLSKQWAERCIGLVAEPGVSAVRVDEAYRRRRLHGLGGTMMARADVLRAMNGYDEDMLLRCWEDTDLANRLGMVGEVRFYPVQAVKHIDHGGERSASNENHAKNKRIMLARKEPKVNPGRKFADLGWPDIKITGMGVGTATESGKQGLYYTATGRFIAQARHSIMSARLWCPGIEVATTGFDADGCIRIPDADAGPQGWQTRGWKLNMDSISPFKKTLYLDADTTVCGDVAAAFEVLDDYDIMMVHDPVVDFRGSRHLSPADKMETQAMARHVWPQFNGGVVGFRKTDKARKFFAAWRTEWGKLGHKDQGALARAIILTKPRIFALGRQWNGPRDEAIIWHRICEGLPDAVGQRGTVVNNADMWRRHEGFRYIQRRK